MLHNDLNFLKTVITGDEIWGIILILLLSPQQTHRNTLILGLKKKKKKSQQIKNAGEVMINIFFDHKNVIYQHDAPPKSTATYEHYML